MYLSFTVWPHGEGPGNKSLEIASSKMNATSDILPPSPLSPLHSFNFGFRGPAQVRYLGPELDGGFRAGLLSAPYLGL